MIKVVLETLQNEKVVILEYNTKFDNRKISVYKKGGVYYINHQNINLEKKHISMINNGYTNFNGVFSYISNLLNDIENIKFDKVTSCKFVGKEVKEWKKKIKNMNMDID